MTRKTATNSTPPLSGIGPGAPGGDPRSLLAQRQRCESARFRARLRAARELRELSTMAALGRGGVIL